MIDRNFLIAAFVLALALPRPVAAQAPPAKELTAQELDALWTDLAGDDAKKGWAAINILARNPKQGFPLYKEKLKPIQKVDNEQIEKLVKDLDNQQFADRQKAEAELEKLQELARPALEKALAAKPPLEVAKRIEALIGKLGGTVAAGEKLQTIRAIESLQHMATPEALELLKTMAGGAAEARVTQEAQFSVDFLSKRLATPKP